MFIVRKMAAPIAMGLLASPLFAATPIRVDHLSPTILSSLSLQDSAISMQTISRERDHHHTVHTRLRQTYFGVPVWGADVVTHEYANKKPSTMNGMLMNELKVDLGHDFSFLSNEVQQQYAEQRVKMLHPTSQVTKTKKIIFVDKNNKAHYAYLIVLSVVSATERHQPTYIIDASTLRIYETWDDVKTLEPAFGGGFGGNEKSGQLTFDGLSHHLVAFDILRDPAQHLCYLQNKEVTIRDYRHENAVMQFACDQVSVEHNHVYWDADSDAVDGNYSPAHDALYGAKMVSRMYRDWYNVPALVDENGHALQLPIVVHHPMTNASWDEGQVTLGDSQNNPDYYAFTSLDVLGHEIGHGFTEQHSNLVYHNQSGGLNEAFSDMSAMAVEYYAFKENNWLVGWKFMRGERVALRFMNQPSQDCRGKEPGDKCSIDEAAQYRDGMNVHHSSGVFNRLFYLMSTAKIGIHEKLLMSWCKQTDFIGHLMLRLLKQDAV